MIKRLKFIVLAAAIGAFLAAPAPACLSASMFRHSILPSAPSVTDKDAVVLKVFLAKRPDWWNQLHDYAELKVLGVIKGYYHGKTVDLPLRPKNSCEMIGVIGKAGYVVIKKDKYGWSIVPYLVSEGKAFSADWEADRR